LRILITGGSGFIGSHLAERLLGQRHQVEILDPVKPKVSGPWTWVGQTCQDFAPFISKKHFDFIYHLAATVGVTRVLENPSACIANNIDSLRAVLSLGIPGMFTSTSEVYGKTAWVLREDSPIEYSSKSRWSYAASKLIGEWMALQAGWKVVRLFNVIGPRQSSGYGAVLPTFVRQALNGEPITVYGSGGQTRTFIDVRDCVEILDRLRDQEFDVVNVGGTHIYTIQELAELVASTWKAGIRHVPYTEAYPDGFEECPSRVPNLDKLDSLVPMRPSTSIMKTISDLAESLATPELQQR